MRTLSFLLFFCFYVFLENSYSAASSDGVIEQATGKPILEVHPIAGFSAILAEHISANPGIPSNSRRPQLARKTQAFDNYFSESILKIV